MEEEDKNAKDKAWERSQAMALRGRGFRFRCPCPSWPHRLSLPPHQPVNPCPFKQHLVPPGPFFPVLQPAQALPRTTAPLLQWTSATTHPPALLSHLPTPPYCRSLPPSFTFLSTALPDLRDLDPRPIPLGRRPFPSHTLFKVGAHAGAVRTALDAVWTLRTLARLEQKRQRPRERLGAEFRPFLEGEREGEEVARRFRPLVAV